MSNVTFDAYKKAFFDGISDAKNGIKLSKAASDELLAYIDLNKESFADGSSKAFHKNVTDKLAALEEGDTENWNPRRDLCIAGWMSVGAAIVAAWVASGGTLIVGTVVAGVTITNVIIAALVGGASAGTIACITGACGDC